MMGKLNASRVTRVTSHQSHQSILITSTRTKDSCTPTHYSIILPTPYYATPNSATPYHTI